MMKRKLFIFEILIFYILVLSPNIAFAQNGKYYGVNYSCREVYSVSQNYWLDLQEDSSFEYHSFYTGKKITTCRSMRGNWEITGDTLKLIKNKRRISYYLIRNDSIISPEFYSLIYSRRIDIDNKGIDDFGLGVLLFQPLNILLEDKSGLTKESIIYWTDRRCQ